MCETARRSGAATASGTAGIDRCARASRALSRSQPSKVRTRQAEYAASARVAGWLDQRSSESWPAGWFGRSPSVRATTSMPAPGGGCSPASRRPARDVGGHPAQPQRGDERVVDLADRGVRRRLLQPGHVLGVRQPGDEAPQERRRERPAAVEGRGRLDARELSGAQEVGDLPLRPALARVRRRRSGEQDGERQDAGIVVAIRQARSSRDGSTHDPEAPPLRRTDLPGPGSRTAVMPSARYRRPAVWRSEREERAWVRAAQVGEAAGVERLFERYWPVAYRTAYLIVHDAAAAEDIAQEAFLASIRALGRFDRRRPFGPWLTRIVANRSIDHARARALRREAFDDAALAYVAGDAEDPRPTPGRTPRRCGPRSRTSPRSIEP